MPLKVCKRRFDQKVTIVDFCAHTLDIYQIAATEVRQCLQPETIRYVQCKLGKYFVTIFRASTRSLFTKLFKFSQKPSHGANFCLRYAETGLFPL
jgi:hypothetical protein